MSGRLGNNIVIALITIAIIAVWETGVRVFNVSPLVLPPPSVIGGNIVGNFPHLAYHAWVTGYEIVLGFLAGAVLGIGCALVMAEYAWARGTLYPMVIASQTIPKIAIAPLFIIWFGVGIYPKIMIVALLAFFPILINTISGLESTDRGHLDLLRSVDASKAESYWYIRFPTALPYLFAGLKLGITVSVIGAIVAEWVASSAGLGYLLLFYTQYMDMANTFSVLVILIALGLICFAVIEIGERLFSWEARVRRQTRTNVAESNL